jgi:RNA pseudouridylate synthase
METEPPPELSRVGTTSLAESTTPAHCCEHDDIKSSQPTAANASEGDNDTKKDSSTFSRKQQQQRRTQQRGGKKQHPRPKRNRKRPRSQVHGYSNDDLVIQSKVIPLTLNGQPILTGGIPYSSSSSSTSSSQHSISGNVQSNDAEPSSAVPVPASSSSSSQRSSLFVRVIEPYPYTFTSHAKSRWIGRTILDVYTSEFGSYPASYYETAIQQGRILVSDQVVDASYCIRPHDVLCHVVHRHEPAVLLHSDTAPFVKIVGETDTLLAVDKPGTVPIHPCGSYHENCLLQLLYPVYGKLYTIYRLDRLTSGLVIFGKSSAAAKVCSTAMKERGSASCRKIYIARVKGQFPRNCPFHVPFLVQVKCHDDNSSTTSCCKRNRGFPIDGTLDDETNIEVEDDGNLVVATIRRRNAYGYWFSNSTAGENNVNSPPNVSLEKFSTLEHSTEEFLQALAQEMKKRQERNDQDCDNVDSSSRSTTDLVWLDFACPVRISNPKIGVCVSSPSRGCKRVHKTFIAVTIQP